MFGVFGGRKLGEPAWEGKMALVLILTEDPNLSLPEENV